MSTVAANPPLKAKRTATRGMLWSYITGFLLSLLLTITAYTVAVNQSLAHNTLIMVLVGLAIAQLLAQLIFFLHLGRESRPRFNLVVFLFMLMVLGILVGGSLWIMHNLNYHMSPHQMDKKLLEQYQEGGI
jgi:cytochrome o ubiquinol oxidase operon protein cyoD